MYSNAQEIDIIIERAAKFVINNDRTLHSIFFNHVEKLSKELGIIIGGRTGMLILSGASPDYTLNIWDLYCEDTFNTAKRLAIELSKLYSPHLDAKTISLNTSIKHRELTIFINARKIFNIYGLKRGQLKFMASPAIGFTGASILVMAPICQLIEMYGQFYSPAADWGNFDFESAIFNNMGAYKPSTNTPSNLIAPKILIGQCIHIGDFAASKYINQAAIGRLQILTAAPIIDVSIAISKCYNIARDKLVTKKYDLGINDFRLTKHTIYELNGNKMRALCDVFNSPEYEIIPYDMSGIHRVANIFVIMRFLAIDIYTMSSIGADNVNKLKSLSALRDVAYSNLEVAFNFVNYSGILTSDATAKKKIIRAARDIEGFLPAFYPGLSEAARTADHTITETNSETILMENISDIIGSSDRLGASIIMLDDLAPKVSIMCKFARNSSASSIINDLQKYAKKPQQSQWAGDKKINFRRYANFTPHLPEVIDTYIDIGCGSGLDACALDHNFTIKRIILADIEDIRVINNTCTQMEFIKIICGQPIDLPNQSVNLVSIFHSIHHMLGDVKCRLDDIARICAPGALVLIKDHDVRNSSDAHDVDFEHFVYLLPEHPGVDIYDLAVQFPSLCPMEYYSASEIRTEFISRGFQQIYFEIINPVTHVYTAIYKKI